MSQKPPVNNPPYQENNALQNGQLLAKLKEATQRGLKTGALSPLSTTFTTIIDHTIPFQVHQLAQLQRKEAARAIQVANKEQVRPSFDPFLPYEQDLFVADISQSHVAVLNKFNVVPYHMLLITREFEHQSTPLTTNDMLAVTKCLQEENGLVFYNSDEKAGASQPHKHLQFVLLPLTEQAPETPLSSLIYALPETDTPQQIPLLPFAHAVCRYSWKGTESTQSISRRLLSIYHTIVKTLNKSQLSDSETFSYNLLLTRHWMLLVPRKQEFCGNISVNALGFAGTLLARHNEDRMFIQKKGPLHILQEVTFPLPKKEKKQTK